MLFVSHEHEKEVFLLSEKYLVNKSIAWLLLVPVILSLVYGINNYSRIKNSEPKKTANNTQIKKPARKQIIKTIALKEIPIVKAKTKTEAQLKDENQDKQKAKQAANIDSSSTATSSKKAPSSKPINDKNENKVSSTSKIKVTLKINKGSGQKDFPTEVASKSTVFVVLKTASLKYDFSLTYTNYAYGAFIEEIDGVRSDKNQSMYWLYYINGKLANLGVSSQKVKEGDVILWKYEKAK